MQIAIHSKILIERLEMDERRASRGVVNNRSSRS
jgi:hypothetical protein